MSIRSFVRRLEVAALDAMSMEEIQALELTPEELNYVIIKQAKANVQKLAETDPAELRRLLDMVK